MSILRTIAMFIYLFGYMILHSASCAAPSAPQPPEIPPPWSRS